eukprot:3160589-Rhodomonas_salina.1
MLCWRQGEGEGEERGGGGEAQPLPCPSPVHASPPTRARLCCEVDGGGVSESMWACLLAHACARSRTSPSPRRSLRPSRRWRGWGRRRRWR